MAIRGAMTRAQNRPRSYKTPSAYVLVDQWFFDMIVDISKPCSESIQLIPAYRCLEQRLARDGIIKYYRARLRLQILSLFSEECGRFPVTCSFCPVPIEARNIVRLQSSHSLLR